MGHVNSTRCTTSLVLLLLLSLGKPGDEGLESVVLVLCHIHLAPSTWGGC